MNLDNILEQIGEQSPAEDRLEILQETTHTFTSLFPEIEEDYQYCLAKLWYLAENCESIVAEYAVQIRSYMIAAQKSCDRLQTLQNSEGESLHLKSLQEMETAKSASRQSTLQVYSEVFMSQLEDMTDLSPSRMRRNRTVVRDLLEQIKRYADLMAYSRTMVSRLEMEDELFVVEEVCDEVEDYIEDLSSQRQQDRLAKELVELGGDWTTGLGTLQDDFHSCLSYLFQIENKYDLEEYRSGIYCVMVAAQEAWERLQINDDPASSHNDQITLSRSIDRVAYYRVELARMCDEDAFKEDSSEDNYCEQSSSEV